FQFKESCTPYHRKLENRSCRLSKRLQNNRIEKVSSTESRPSAEAASGVKRMVLIDGNNVAFAHSHNKEFSVEGIEICLKYFADKGYDAKAIVPQMRLKKNRSSNQDLLAKLETEGKVVFSPCKNLPNGKKVTSYDDRFILDFAADYDAAVISNDNYRDLSKECEKYRDIINTRVIGFTFLNDIIRFPQDPYGKLGPSLNDILNGKGK
ncbi:putative ribonuclease ZC3H12D, partial [Pseudolycoriella hygida]